MCMENAAAGAPQVLDQRHMARFGFRKPLC